MIQGGSWVVVLGGLLLLSGSGCTVQQQQQVLGTIGTMIPGSRSSSGSTSESETAPKPRVDPERVDAQLVLKTLQRAMTDGPLPFQECLDNSPCKLALTAHLIRLQKQADGALELPPIYDRYD